MNCFDVLKELNFNERSLMHGWGQSFANMPEKIGFLQPETIAALRRECGIADHIEKELISAAGIIAQTPCLKAFAWHVYYKLVYREAETPSFKDWPMPEHHLGEAAPIMYLLVVLGAMPHAVKIYRDMGISETIIRDTIRLSSLVDFYKFNFKVTGAHPAGIHWFRHMINGRLFQLGRMQFTLTEYSRFGMALRNRGDGTKIILSEPGISYDGQGLVASSGRTAALTVTDESVTGFPIDPAGFAICENRTFSRREWDIILRSGDIVIDMHIPFGGGMTPEACRESYLKAFRFFGERFPGKFSPVVRCGSWIFNTQFEDKLPQSNLVWHMRQGYLYPMESTGKDGFFFIFGRDYDDLGKAPRDTSMRRTMLEILESGQLLRKGGMILFEEDMNDFGNMIYRKNFQQHKLKG
jgi:hypothetical protein